MSKKTTKRALAMSFVSVFLCVCMLVGTTFAWFTDSVSSVNNVIQSGNLDVVLEVGTLRAGGDSANPNDWNWNEVDPTKPVIELDNVEPGYVKTVALRVRNAGSLALKYALSTSIVEETEGVNVAGNKFNLSDKLYTFTSKSLSYTDWDREQILDIIDITLDGNFSNGFGSGTANTAVKAFNTEICSDMELLTKDDYDAFAFAVAMPTWVGNEANHNGTAPKLTFGINVVATQLTYEKDSFGDDYDEDAKYPVINAKDLADALAKGEDVKLEADVALTEAIEISGDVTIDLNGFDMDASAIDSAFTVAAGEDASLTINGNDEEVQLGKNGLVDVAAGADAVIEINGGNFVSDDAGSTLIKPDGDGKIKVVLNDVNYKSTATNGYALDCSYYDGADLSVEINGGSFEATTGMLLPEGSSVKGAKITAKNTKNMQPAVYAMGDMTIENCIIKAEKSHAVAVAGGATLTVKDCEVYAGSDAGALAFQVFSSGGTINVINTTYNGGYGTTGKMKAGCVAIINIDNVEVYRKGG